ncbi:putative inactive poly [ADP-ribose] polymerase SRO5 [Bienertia sinuspersici]
MEIQNCEEDNDGLKHALLCRVLVKNKNSSSDNSDTDEAISPSQYFVSRTRNNQHKWKTSAISSPWLPFKTLIPIISKFLPPYTMRLIIENYKDFEAGKISRQDWIQRLRQFAGNDLLTKIIKSFGAHNSEAI